MTRVWQHGHLTALHATTLHEDAASRCSATDPFDTNATVNALHAAVTA